jgi:opacity protein-like surface antigen
MLAGAGVASAADLPPQGGMTYSQPAPYYDPGQWYVRGDAGLGIYDGSGDPTAFTAGMGIGYRWSEIFRSDLTVDYTGEYNNAVGASDADAWTVMANGYIDFAFGQMLKPYVGAGIGWGSVDYSGGAANDDDGLALAFHTGLTFDLAPATDLDVGYRYRTISVSGPDFDDHAIRAGIRYKF